MRQLVPTQRLQTVVQGNVVMLGVLATALLLAPGRVLSGFGIAEAPVAVLGLTRVIATMAGILAAVLWGVRESLGTRDGRFALRLLIVAHALGAVLLFAQQWSVWDGRSGVALSLGCALLAVQYGV